MSRNTVFKKEEGFTLIELMIVIAIIGILAAIAIPNFISYRNKSYCTQAENDAQAIKTALGSYFSVPTRTALPTIASLKTLEKLSLVNTAVDPAGDVNGVIIIAVNDDSKKCPASNVGAKKFTVYMGTSTKGSWQ